MRWVPVPQPERQSLAAPAAQDHPAAATCSLGSPSVEREEDHTVGSTVLERAGLPAREGKKSRKGSRRRWADIASDSDDEIPDLFAMALGDEDNGSPFVAGQEDFNGAFRTASSGSRSPSVSRWANQLLALSVQLNDLASAVPLAVPMAQDRGTCTYLHWDDVLANLEDMPSLQNQLEAMTGIVANLEERMRHAESTARQAELVMQDVSERAARQKAAAFAVQAALSGALADRSEGHSREKCVLEEMCERETLMRERLALAQMEERKRADANRELVADLETKIRQEMGKAEEAGRAATSAFSTKELWEDMPKLQDRLEQAQKQAWHFQGQQLQLERLLESLRADVAAVTRPGGKVQALETRVADLESECKELAAGPHEDAQIQPSMEALVAAEKESSRQLLLQIKGEKQRKEDVDACSLEALQARQAYEEAATAENQQSWHQVAEAKQRYQKTCHDRQSMSTLVQALTRKSEEIERQGLECRSRREEIERTTRKLTEAKRKAEEAASVKEWRWQQKLKEKPGNGLDKLALRRPKVPAKSWQSAGSDVGDAESTTAGESATESVLACLDSA